MSCGLKINLAEFQYFHIKIDTVLQQITLWPLAYRKETKLNVTWRETVMVVISLFTPASLILCCLATFIL